jgi:hypothetical protein
MIIMAISHGVRPSGRHLCGDVSHVSGDGEASRSDGSDPTMAEFPSAVLSWRDQSAADLPGVPRHLGGE